MSLDESANEYYGAYDRGIFGIFRQGWHTHLYPHEIRRTFLSRPGSKEIASDFALERIWSIYRDRVPESICEIGHGIGTITFTLAMWRVGRNQIVAVEDDAWCIEQARRNLGELGRLVLWYDRMPVYEIFEMVVVDGPQIGAQHWQSCLAERAIVLFEGNRRGQRELLESVLRSTGRPFCRVNLKPPDRSKGLWVYQVEPTRTERRQMWRWSMIEWWRDLRARWNGHVVGKRRAT